MKLYELDNNLENLKSIMKNFIYCNFERSCKLILKHYKNSNIFVEKPMCQNLNEFNLIRNIKKKI